MNTDKLTETHAEYAYWLDAWQFFIRSYHGGKYYRDGNYLLQHPFESGANYIRRKETAYFYNYCSPIVDILISHIFKQDAIRDFGSLTDNALFANFLKNCDFKQTPLNQFMRDATRLASIYGRITVIIDKPPVTLLTEQLAQSLDVRPYISIVTPENLTNWTFGLDEKGVKVLTSITVLEDVTPSYLIPVAGAMLNDWKPSDGSPMRVGAVQGRRKGFYRMWTRNAWQLWQCGERGEATLINEGVHGLGVIPAVNIYNRKSGVDMIGVSDLQDIADINKNIYYLCSDAKEIIENTAFPMLATAWNKGGENNSQAVGPKNIQQFDPELSNSKPFWLEAPHSSLAEIREWIQQDLKEAFRIAKMGGIRTMQDTVQPMSGVALDIENQHLYAALSEKADNVERAETEIMQIWALWQGLTFDGCIDYPDNFSVADTVADLQISLQIKDGGIDSETFRKEIQKKIVQSILPKIDDETRDIIFAEIEASKNSKANLSAGEMQNKNMTVSQG